MHEKTLDLCLGNISYNYSFFIFYGLDPLSCLNYEFSFETTNLVVVWQDPLDDGKPVTWLLPIQDIQEIAYTSIPRVGFKPMIPVVEAPEDSS
jgi:hypothetical protein